MKLTVTYTLTGQDPVTVLCGPMALSAAEKNFHVKVVTDGLTIEQLAYVAWTQAVKDGRYLGPFTEFTNALDDLDAGAAAGPPTPGREP